MASSLTAIAAALPETVYRLPERYDRGGRAQAVSEGFRNVEHVKRYTALGFGTDQGKLGNINGMALLAECLDKPIAEVGTTTYRPPYTAVTFGACAGADVGTLYEPVRKTALHDWHEAAGAEFEVVGQWLRPWYYPGGGGGHAQCGKPGVSRRRAGHWRSWMPRPWAR